MNYSAPIRDLAFVLEEVVAMNGLKATGAFDDLSDDLVTAVLNEAGRFTGEVLAPLNTVGDREGTQLGNDGVKTAPGFKEAYAQFVEGGWQGLTAPADAGGAGMPRALGWAVMEMVQASNMSFGLGPMLTHAAIEALVAHGSDEQRRVYLPKLVTGEWAGTMNLTEPQAGSDLSLVRSTATPVGDGSYRLNGQKIYITWGDHDCADNIVHLVLARLPGAPAGTAGISLFLAPKFLPGADGAPGERNGLRPIGVEEKLGIHASPTCTMAFEDATAWLVGQENRGLAHMFTMMNSARISVGVQGVAIAERAYQLALAYARERRQGRTPNGDKPGAIIGHPDVRRMLMTMKAKIEAGRAICLAAGVAADYAAHSDEADDAAAAARREALLTPISKAWCTDVGVEVASLGVQVHGGMGFIEETGAAQHYRDARIAPIYEGTNGIQSIDLVGRKLVHDGGAGMRELLDDVRETAEDMSLSSNPQLPQLARRLADGADALERAADWLRADGREEVDRLAGATPFLTLAGDVVGGWKLCVGAVAAARRLKDGEGDAAYAQAKIDLARYYAETVLVRASGWVDDVTAGAEAVLAVPDDLLGP